MANVVKIQLCSKCGSKLKGNSDGRQVCSNPLCDFKLFKGNAPYKPQGGCGGCGKK